MGAHDGHRKRLKERFLREGAERLQEHELLELLLFYAIPRSDTNETAHALLSRFGSIAGVAAAPLEALEAVPGVGANAATLIKTVDAVRQRIDRADEQGTMRILVSEDAAAILEKRFRGLDRECVYLLCIDARRRVLCCEQIASGSLSEVEISVRSVAELALRNGAQGVIVAHNHPDAPALPSREDELVTIQIMKALATIGVTLIDHIIVSDTEYYSMADNGALVATQGITYMNDY